MPQPALISIHSPHARGDHNILQIFCTPVCNFNPLPSCEGRPHVSSRHKRPTNFNPLPSCEGRPRRAGTWRAEAHFNPLPSCEGRRFCAAFFSPGKGFQSTPLMRGETGLRQHGSLAPIPFQSTPLMRGETATVCMRWRETGISIHSPHARGDYSGD